MISTFGKAQHGKRRTRSRVGCAWALAMSVILHTWSIDPATAQPTVPKAYRITAGDKIGVTVFGQPDLSGESTVDQSGNIRLPMIGDIRAVSLTLTELEGSIAQALTPAYIRNPTVSIRIAEFSPIYVVGLVRTPGVYSYREGGACSHSAGGRHRRFGNSAKRYARNFVSGGGARSPAGNKSCGPSCKTGSANRTAKRQ